MSTRLVRSGVMHDEKGVFFVASRKLHRNLPCFVNIESIEEIVHHELGARTDKKHARMR